MILFDRASAVGKARKTKDGYVVADVRVARTGIQEYAGSEIGRPDMPVVRVYRPPEEVFAKDSLQSYAHKPVTNDHPSQMVTADTWKRAAIGQIGEDVVRDGEYVRVPLVMMDGEAIKAWEDGKRELSMGYTAEIVFDSGKTPEGEEYDAVQTNLRMNHVALVGRARGGSNLRIGDDTHKRITTMSDTKTVMVDGLSVVTTDAGAQAINKLQGQIQDAARALETAKGEHAATIAAKDAAIGELTAKVKTLEDAALKPEQLDRMVADRAALVATAKAVAPEVKTEGVTDAEIRKAVVSAKLGADFVADASPDAITGAFRVLVKDAKPADPFRDAMRSATPATPVTDNGYAASVAALDYRTRNAKTA
jgi:hypothetical protein